jgi:beta-lactamase class A
MSLRSLPVARLLVALILLISPGAARAQEEKPAPATPPTPAATPVATELTLPDTAAGKVMGRVIKSLNDPTIELGAAAFGEAFLKQVPYEQVTSIIKSLRERCGTFTPVKIEQQTGERNLVVRASVSKGQQPWQIILGLAADDKIETLLLRPAPTDEPVLKNWVDFDERLAKLGGQSNFAAYQVRMLAPAAGQAAPPAPKLAEVHLYHADSRLALGSTFKLYVLGALAEAVNGGKARWDENLAIKPFYKSLPSGKMQDERDGAEFPIARYADQMISISDNTAADHLIHRVGREQVEAYMSRLNGKPELNKPFLTTRELFALRLSSDTTLVNRWLAADEHIRRDMLLPDDLYKPTRPAGATHNPGEIANWVMDVKAVEKWKTPRHIDKIEWFASADDCCRLMADIARLEQLPGMEPLGHALRINPGLPPGGQRWSKIAFKGGSEPGVMNLTFLLTRDDGNLYAASIGWNDSEKPLDEAKLVGLMTRALELMGKEP